MSTAMSKKLIFLDIDGTLTAPGAATPPDSAMAAVRAARNAGHTVLLCSGRCPAMVSPLLRLGFDGAVTCAGGYVFCGGRVLYDCPMTEEMRDEALRLFRENGVCRTIEARDACYCDEEMDALLASVDGQDGALVRWHRAFRAAYGIRPMREYDGRPVYKIMYTCAREDQLSPVRAALADRFRFVMQEAFSEKCVTGEIINRRFSKGSGVRCAAEALGFALADTVGFGDSMNDLEMMETVGFSVCMENGSEELKRVSDLVCPSVEADGLAWAFARLGLG